MGRVDASWSFAAFGRKCTKRNGSGVAKIFGMPHAFDAHPDHPTVLISRGGFTSVFMVQVLQAIGAKELRLD